MRRLPIYILVDTSASMAGAPMEAVRAGLGELVKALHKDPKALETAYLSVITFGETAQQIVPLTVLREFRVPELFITGGGSSLGAALKLLCECREREIQKTTKERRGDWRPMVFILTDGVPTDDPTEGIKAFRSKKWGTAVSCVVGADADTDLLKQITKDVVALEKADSTSFALFFRWVAGPGIYSSDPVANPFPPPPDEAQIV